jgi:hypothetical protein
MQELSGYTEQYNPLFKKKGGAGGGWRLLPYDPPIPLLGIYSKELKTGTQTYTCMPKLLTSYTNPKKVGISQMSIHG